MITRRNFLQKAAAAISSAFLPLAVALKSEPLETAFLRSILQPRFVEFYAYETVGMVVVNENIDRIEFCMTDRPQRIG